MATSVGFPVMSIDEKVIKIKELVDNLQKNYDIDDERLIPKELFKDNDLNLLKNILLKDYKLKKGHSQSDNDKLIQEFFNHCVANCVKEEKLEFMIAVAVLFPDLVTKSYKSTVANLIMQLTYVKIPSKWTKENESTFHSIRENLWGYKFPDHESPLSQFDKLEKIPPHSATLCYVPLPGLCTYPKCSSIFNTLFPCHLSPFAKFIISNASETKALDTSQASFKIYESAPFQAIIKFKWHAFARWRFFGNIFVYLSHFVLYTAAFSKTNRTTEGKWLMIASMILEAILIFCKIRHMIICVVNGITVIGQLTYTLLILVPPIITGFLFLHNDTSETFSILQTISIFLLWIGFIGYLVVFKNIGIFIIVIMHICRKLLWLLVLITIVLIAIAHSAMVYLIPKLAGVNEAYKDDARGAFSLFYDSFIFIWDFFLSNYTPWKDHFFVDILRIASSFFTSIIMLNLLIAIVNNVYEEVLQRAHAQWTIVRAKCIVHTELIFMMPSERQNRDYFPLTITYEAFTEDVDKWPKKLKDDNIPIPWEEEMTITEGKLRQFLYKFVELQKVAEL